MKARIDFTGGWTETTTFRQQFGAHIVNCAIEIDEPVSCGLGGSSLQYLCATGMPEQDIIDAVKREEKETGVCGSYQDIIGAVYPGVKSIRIESDDTFSVSALQTSELNMFIFDTGIKRNSHPIIKHIEHNYNERLLRWSKKLSDRFVSHSTDIEKIGFDVSCEFMLKVKLHLSIVNKQIMSALYEIHNYVHGSSMAGAGSGGCLFGFLKDTKFKSDTIAILKKHFPNGNEVNYCYSRI